MDEAERQMFKERLLQELYHFKEREQLYVEKRRELQELELTFRKNQKFEVHERDMNENRSETDKLIISTLTS